MKPCIYCGNTHPEPQFAPGRLVFDLKDGVAFAVEQAVFDHETQQVLYWRTMGDKPKWSRGSPAAHLLPWGPPR